MMVATIILLFAVIFAMVFALEMKKAADFNERFPPIDDDEFIRRCRPGVNRGIALRVRRIISEQLGIQYERVYPEQANERA